MQRFKCREPMLEKKKQIISNNKRYFINIKHYVKFFWFLFTNNTINFQLVELGKQLMRQPT